MEIIEIIMDSVVTVTGITREQILGDSKNREICDARHLYAALVKWETKMPLKAIANLFKSKRDHTTIVYAIKKAKALIKNEKPFRQTYETICKLIQFSLFVDQELEEIGIDKESASLLILQKTMSDENNCANQAELF